MNPLRKAQTSLESSRDKLLKYHDQAIERKLKEREREYDALHQRLDNYASHVSDRIHRERQKEKNDEEVARMRKEEARWKRELLERIEQNEKIILDQLAEKAHLQQTEEMMRQCGAIAGRIHRTNLARATSTNSNINASNEGQEIIVSRRMRSDPRDGLLSIDFSNYQHVQIIRASSVNLGVAGARALAQGLLRGACQELKELHLAWNAIGDGGLSYLVEAFALNSPKLSYLDLAGNGITSEGIHGLKFALAKKNAKTLVGLKYLSVRRNPIKALGAKELAHMLLNGWLPTLECLDISSCDLGTTGLKALRSSLSSEALASRLAPRLQMVTARDNNGSISEVATIEGFWPNVLQI
jgi:hypothetical protein